MAKHAVDAAYIQNEITNAKCIGSRAPDQYLTISRDSDDLPTITFEKYQERSKTIPCFLIGNQVVDLVGDLPSKDQPLMRFLHTRAIGQPDFTSVLVEILYDPDLPEQDQHWRWAEDQLMDLLAGSGMCECARVTMLLDNK